ncbi:MAG TPA: HAMP domain-containing sensor histidine kinase [Flavobacteriaceae bacterium]|nr:HAMP domain-containing sensor histidine kinase [Flavobacteriaceae bacterium]
MKTVSTTKTALKERIKELTCLYEVSSFIVNADFEQIQETFSAIAYSLKKALQFPEKTEILIETQEATVQTGKTRPKSSHITGIIYVFNLPKGKIVAASNDTTNNTGMFLKEEQELINNIALKIGSLLERIEIKKNEITMKRQVERADRLAIMGELTAGIAHELNTPLANILGFAELLKAENTHTEKTREDLDKIIQNAIFSREVVKKLMFFTCEMPHEMKPVNIVPNLKNAIDLLDATFRKKGVKYIVKIHEEELWLRADKVQLTQVLFNLIINAIYFTPPNGLVTIEALQTSKEVVLKISDEGIGLSPEALEKVFQPFFTTKPIGEGSGLGLSVVHGIVSSHKGTITAKNNREKGAIFEVKLPKQ